MGRRVEPDGFRALLARITGDYPGLPLIYITENGAAYDDTVRPDGIVEEPGPDRVSRPVHLHALHETIEAGVQVRGYFYWSFLDNFEWAEGYAKRFGLVYVDCQTQRRIPKASARWYSEVMRRNGLSAPRLRASQPSMLDEA